jgi:hypothetical protein
MNPKLAALFLCGALASPAVRAGVTVTLEGKERTSTLYLEGNKARIEERIKDGRERVTVFDGGRLLMLDPQEKTYQEMTEADVKALGARMKSQKAEARLTAEQRRQTEGVAGGGPSAQAAGEKTRFIPTGEKRTVAGFRCEVHRELKGAKPEGEGCYIPWGAGAVTTADLTPFERMEKFMEPMLGQEGGVAKGITSELASMPGFPAWHVEISEGGARGEEETLRSLKRESVPAEKFALPAGYQRVPSGFGE